MTPYAVVWDGNIRASHGGRLCVEPDEAIVAQRATPWGHQPTPIAAARRRLTAEPSAVQVQATLILALLRRHRHVCRVPALVAQSALTAREVVQALDRLLALRLVTKITISRPGGHRAVGFQAR